MEHESKRPRGQRKPGVPIGISPRTSPSPPDRLEWKNPDMHWLACLGAGALVMVCAGGTTAFCVFLLTRTSTILEKLFILATVGPIAVALILGTLQVWFWRQHTILDKSLGTCRITTRIAGKLVKEFVTSIQDADSVCVKFFVANKSRIRYLLQIKKRKGDPIFMGRFQERKEVDELSVKLAEFLDAPIEYAKLTPEEAAREYRFVKKFFALAYAMLGLFFADFAFEFTVPVVRDVLALSHYRAEDLVQTPCRILSFEVHQPKDPDTAHITDGGLEVRITEGTQANVRFEYTYAGKRYESTRYGPLGSSAAYDVTPYPPGHEAVCYLNPNWPADAVLITEARARPIFLAVLVQLVIMPIFLAGLVSMQRSFRKLYLKDLGWPEGTTLP